MITDSTFKLIKIARVMNQKSLNEILCGKCRVKDLGSESPFVRISWRRPGLGTHMRTFFGESQFIPAAM